MSAARISLGLCLASGLACADDGAVATQSSSGAESSSSSSSSSGEPTSTTGSATSGEPDTSSSGEPGFDPPTPVCGNGYLEADEECDDGNLAAGDACNAACQVPCGLELAVSELAPTAQSVIGGLSVAPAPDGGFVTVARLREITVDREQNPTVGPRLMLVLAYDAGGALRWRSELGDMMGDLYAAGGSVDTNGDVLVVGSVDGPEASAIWVGKLDGSDGGALWTRAIDGQLAGGDDFGSAVVGTPGGDVIATGTPDGVGAGRKPPLWMKPGDKVELTLERSGTSSMTLGFRMVSRDPPKRFYADGSTVLVWIDRATGKSTPLPASVRAALSR